MCNRKLKVLIVDDEYRIGQLIKRLIDWNEIGLECIAVLDNGESAYKVILEQNPDIVITDVRMPKINGLDLICMTKEVREHIQFIVISGYKEFEYAHRALQYGVNDYLLKPIDEKELNVVLRKIVNEMLTERKVEKEMIQMEQKVSTSESIIRQNVLNNIIEQEELSLDEIAASYNLDFAAEIYRGIDIKLDYWDYEKNDAKQDRLTVEKVISIMEQNLEGHVKEQLICQKSNLNIYCLFNYENGRSKEIKNIINTVLSEIQEFLIRFEQYEVTIGIGTEKREFGEIRLSIQEAYQAVQNRIRLGTGRLIYAKNICTKKKINIKEYIERYKEQMINSIETYNRSIFEQCMNQLYGELQIEEDIDFSVYYYLANGLIDFFFNTIDVQNKEGEQLKEFLFNMSQHCYTPVKLKELLKEYLGEYLDVCLEAVESESIKPVREAKKYMEQHYGEKIVLEDIALLVDLNPVYFSVLFKKEIGVNFSTYLTNIRMEAAKELIRAGNETIAAIAEQVGYKDARYFSQTFTKIVGVKPALYRRLHS
ncbi:MAG: response regulator [Lachnospiraceae bacterium]